MPTMLAQPPSTEFPAVSVVIATRDRPELLRKAVRGAVEQDYPGLVEVFAVFDQTEPAADLESSDPQRPVRVTRNARTPGLPGARNTGIAAAGSPLVAFCDDDDRWLATKLSAQVAAMRRLGLRAAVTGIAVCYGQERRERVFDRDRLSFPDLVRDRVTAAHPSSYLAERALVIDEAGLVDEAIPGGYGEDYDWLLRVARHTDIAVVREPLVEVLWHPGSFFTRRWDTIVEALQYLLDKHPELNADPRGLARIEGQQAFALAALGQRSQAWRKLRSALRHHPLEKRAIATLPVLCGLVKAETVLHTANRLGRGI
jgi:glycosyltransferase involved in cell wall biosynthesis